MVVLRRVARSSIVPFSRTGVRQFSLQAAYESKAQAEGFLPDGCQIKCLTRLGELQTSLLQNKDQKKPLGLRGLYMYGGVGTGKTMMLDLFHQELIAGGIGCDRQHFHEFLQAMNLRLHRLRKRIGSQQGLLSLCAEEYMREFPVLAFDEAHVLNVGDALMMRTFFEAYFNAGGVLVATSNVAPNDLYASGINREVFLPFLNALKEKCDFFEMQGRHDYRGRAAKKGKMRGLYLWRGSDIPVGDPSPEQFLRLRRALALPDGLSYLPVSVDIDVGFGRTLHCETSWNAKIAQAKATPAGKSSQLTRRIVHFTFDELCRTATGPSEWVGLAEFADAIIVTKVPRFFVHDEDAARRFITFVDIVYDKQRFLVITADESPEDIFAELIEKYGGDDASITPVITTPEEEDPPETMGQMKMPGHGLASGRHGVVFQKPKQLQYGTSGAYVTEAAEANGQDAPVKRQKSISRTGGRAENGLGDPDRVMSGVVEEDSDWVEWSATGLKDASLFDLSPTNTHTQVTDKLLPFRRCASRLIQMAR